MIRQATTDLLIAAILGCPFICLSEAAPTSSGTDACCCDHAGCGSDPAQEDPGEDDSDGQSKDCVCGGAVVACLSPKETHLERPATSPGCVLVAAAAEGTVEADISTLTPFSQFPPLCTGREICARVGVLLL